MRPLFAFLPALLYAGIIYALSAQSHPLAFLPHEFLAQDKLLHAGEYAGLAGLLVVGLRRAGLSWRGALVAAVALVSLYGATDEFHQSFVPGRDADVLDWVADTAGAVAGSAIASAFIFFFVRVTTGSLRESAVDPAP
jgi:VanZ family protein